MKRIPWVRAIIGSTLFLFLFASCSTKQPPVSREPKIDVVRFSEDSTVSSSNIEKYHIVSYSLKDAEKSAIKNVWVTRKLLEKREHFDVISKLLENNFNILIEENNFTVADTYDFFHIAKEKRATKTSKKDELADLKQNNLQRLGDMIFKYKDSYYVIGMNSILNNRIEDLLVAFTFDKTKMIGE